MSTFTTVNGTVITEADRAALGLPPTEVEVVPDRTRPTVREMAEAVNLDSQPAGVGDRVPFWNGLEVVYHTITKGDMVKVDRYRSRDSKRAERNQAAAKRRLAEAERDLQRARKAEADRRSALSAEAAARIHGAGK